MTRSAYMKQLKKELRWKCGRHQASAILEDYRRSFEKGATEGRTEETLCARFGDPRMAAKALLREDRTPAWALPWVRLLLAAAMIGTFMLWIGDYRVGYDMDYWMLLTLPLMAYLVLGMEPGQARRQGGGKAFCISLFAVSLICVLAAFIEIYRITLLGDLYSQVIHWFSDGAVWRVTVQGGIHILGYLAAAAAAAAWVLSLWSFPGCVPAYFGMFSIMLAARYLINFFLPYEGIDASLFVYGASILLLGFGLVVLFSRLPRIQPRHIPYEELNRAERVGELLQDSTRILFLQNLSHALKSGFSRWERAEIIEDYTEAFQAGMKEGKSAESLCAAFGHPEAIASILAMERRGRLLAFPAVKAAAMAAMVCLLALLYCRADWWVCFLPAKQWISGLMVVILPLLALIAIGGKPYQKGGTNILPTLYICAIPLLAFFPLALLDACFEWGLLPLISGPLCMAALFGGLALVGAATYLKLRVYPSGAGCLPLLFINAGYLVTNAEFGDLLHSLSAPEAGPSLLAQAFIPLILGIVLALLSYFVLKRPGVAERLGIYVVNKRCWEPAERVQHVSRLLGVA